jgi:hypothetical protein
MPTIVRVLNVLIVHLPPRARGVRSGYRWNVALARVSPSAFTITVCFCSPS